MESWKNLIGRGFTEMDAPFALHPNDRARALILIEEMNAADVSWSDTEAAVRPHLVSPGVKGDRLQGQIARVTEFIRPRLRR